MVSAADMDREEEQLEYEESSPSTSNDTDRRLLLKLGLSFFLFGLINNVLYVIILSAALDLVPPSTPKGIIAFCNIFPALVAKLGWPYVLKGRIRYARRLNGCCTLAVSGMFIVALFDSLTMRLLGICLASFASGLGELTFLQLSTTYRPPSVGGHCVGYFASGTGAAGLVGASVWWVVRGLGVRIGVGLSSILPFVIPLTYYLLLPKPTLFSSEQPSYRPLPTTESDDAEEGLLSEYPKAAIALTPSDKWRLVKPLLAKYMFPLLAVYLLEYTINQGIAPTLVYPVPSPDQYWLLSKVIHSIRDYYPLWQLVYQTTVFLSRSSISLGLPPLPSHLLSLPAVTQAIILTILAVESARGIFEDNGTGTSFALVFFLISIEGFCGGLAYVNVYYRLNQEHHTSDSSSAHDSEKAIQEHEFKIGSVGFSDSIGILLASIAAVPTEIELCKAQVARGKTLCQTL